MSRFAYFSPIDGRVLQWIDTGEMAYNLPDASLLHTCTDADWALRNDDDMMVSGGTVMPYIAQPADPALVKMSKLVAVNGQASARLATLSAAYPDGEVQSWSQQTREAEALAINPDAPAPLLTAISTARGLQLDVLAARVREKVQAYAVASGQIIGQRQALEDAIHAVDLDAPDADAAAQLEAIKWPA